MDREGTAVDSWYGLNCLKGMEVAGVVSSSFFHVSLKRLLVAFPLMMSCPAGFAMFAMIDLVGAPVVKKCRVPFRYMIDYDDNV